MAGGGTDGIRPRGYPGGRFVGRFSGNEAGVSAVEFALVLPLMLAILFGATEFARAFDNRRKVMNLARTVADLTAAGDSQAPMRASALADIMASARLVLAPFRSESAKIVVSALGVDASNSARPRVCSSYATANATARGLGQAGDLTVPDGFRLPGMRYVLAEVSMDYAPVFGSAVMRLLGGARNQFTFTASTPWPVRGGQPYTASVYNEIVLPNGNPCPAT